MEIYYIKFYDTFNTPHGLNLTSGGERTIHSEETIRKISQSNRTRKITKKSRKKNSLSHKGVPRPDLRGEKNGMYGAIYSDEWRKQHSLRLKGKNTWSKGSKKSKETKRKMSLSKMGNQHRLNIPHSKESKIKISIGVIKAKKKNKKENN